MSDSIESPPIPQDIPPAEWARKITEVRFRDELDALLEGDPPSRPRIEVIAQSLGITGTALAAEFASRRANEADKWCVDPLTDNELSGNLTPPWLVEHYLYRDLCVMAGAGGMGKTTLTLWEILHIALGRPLYGLRTCAGSTLYVTGEESRARLAARLNAIMDAMELSAGDRNTVRERVRILDLVGRPFRLCELDRRGNMQTSDDVRRLIDHAGPLDPALVGFDPLASFGAPEETVNTAAQGAVNACRWIIRDLECCVRLTHHTGQVVARENIRDQYAPRGGSALSDGARMVTVLSRLGDGQQAPFPVSADDQALILTRAKCNFAPPQPLIYIKRNGFTFEYQTEIKLSAAEERTAYAKQIETFLIDQLKGQRYYTKTSLEGQDLGIPQKKLRAAINELLVSGRVRIADLPEDRKHGGFKSYLHPVTAVDGVSAKDALSTSLTSLPSTTLSPYREKLDDGVVVFQVPPPSLQPRHGVLTGYDGVDGVLVDNPPVGPQDQSLKKDGQGDWESAVRDHLCSIESDPVVIAEVVDQCLVDPEYRAYWLARAGEGGHHEPKSGSRS